MARIDDSAAVQAGDQAGTQTGAPASSLAISPRSDQTISPRSDQTRARIAAVVGELADLGRRIERRARELARLAETAGRTTSAAARGASLVARAASELASGIAAGGHTTAGDRSVRSARASCASPGSARASCVSPGSARASCAATRPRETTPAKPMRGGPAARPSTHAPCSHTRSPAAAGNSSHSHQGARPRGGGGDPSGEHREHRRRLRAITPLLLSIAVHVLLLVGLALVYVAGDAVLERTPIILGMASDPAADELVSLNMSVADMAAGEPDTSSPDAAAADAPEPFATATAAADTLADHAEVLAAEMDQGTLVDRGGPDALRLFAAVIRTTNRDAFGPVGQA